jgi:hypothetical protein
MEVVGGWKNWTDSEMGLLPPLRLRLTCLELATEAAVPGTAAADILVNARAYEAYILGTSEVK